MSPPDASSLTKGESERRQATILFADISGFTSLSERTDAEFVTSIMNECFSKLGEIVERNGGTIDKFIGDCVMALFGVPQAMEDSPHRAAQTALEMRDCIRESQRTRSALAEMDIHIGINTGEVIAGKVGSEQKKEYTVIGDAVNLASRLKDAAPKGTIYVGQQTYRQTLGQFEYQELAPISFKGKDKPSPVYELLSGKARVPLGRMVFSPLVGRQRELHLLELHVLKAINGEGSIVHVVGEAGLGKSRLVSELKSKDCFNRVTLLEGRALAFGHSLSFHPVMDLLKKWAGVLEEDGDVAAFRKLEKGIRSLSPETAEEALPYIATLMGLRLSGKYAHAMEDTPGDARQKLIFRHARDLLAKGARRRPLVIVLEDMHWADDSTIEFVEYLFQMAEEERVLFVNLFRTQEQKGEHLTQTAKTVCGKRFTEMVLQPLDTACCAELVHNLLKSSSVPPAVTESIIARTGGNPFFIEEIIRSLIDERLVTVAIDGFQLSEELGAFEVPSTVNEVIMTRFDRLERDARELLKIASVIGRRFPYRVLVRLVHGNMDVEAQLQTLLEMQIITRCSGMQEIEYLFTHALAQEVVYESILLQARKILHASVALAIESIFTGRLGEFAGMLAWHFMRAENFLKAEEFMIKAGEEALKSAASSEAITYFRDALELYLRNQGTNADPAKVAMLQTNIARSLFFKGRYAEALPYYEKVQRYYGVRIPKGRTARLFSAAAGLSKGLLWAFGLSRRKLLPLTPELREGFLLSLERLIMLGTLDPLSFAVQALIGLGQLMRYDLRDSEPGLKLLCGISGLFSWSGISLPISRRVIEKMRPLISPERPTAWIFYLYNRVMYAYIAGEWEERGVFRDRVITQQTEQRNVLDVVHILYYAGCICVQCGDWSAFDAANRLLEDISERFDNDEGRLSRHLLVLQYHLARRFSEEASRALREFERFCERKSAHFGEMFLSRASSYTSLVHLFCGQMQTSSTSAVDPVRSFKSTGSLSQNSILYRARAALALERIRCASLAGSLDRRTRIECTVVLRRFLDHARKFAPDRTEALRFMGSYRWYTGHPRRALRYWKRSIREGTYLGAKVELAHTFMDASKLIGEETPGPEWRSQGTKWYAELGIQGE